MGALSIASWGFAIGAVGQLAFYWRLFPNVPQWVLAALVFVPWLTVFTISFCNRPPFGPRPFRRCLIFAMSWHAAMTLTAEALYFALHPAPSGHFPLAVARVLIYSFGILSIVVFVRACKSLRRYERAT
jgi:hypothetical protein